MSANEALAPFETEYTRLYESLYKAHRNEKELLEQCMLLKVKLKCVKRKPNQSFSASFVFFLYLENLFSSSYTFFHTFSICAKCFFRMKLWTTRIK